MDKSNENNMASNFAHPKTIRKITLEEEEDEEMEMDQQNQKSQKKQKSRQMRPAKSKPSSSSQNRELTSEEDNGEDTDESDEDEESEPEIPEMLVPNRSRRPNAGRKMQELLNQQTGEGGDNNEFYTTAYGGFLELERDEDFESPPHSSDDDDIDSDFDRPEDEEIDEEQTDKNIENAERMERRKKKQKQKQLLERNNWAIARINKISVPENNCDPKTQRQRLEEAKNTAKANISSLKRFEEFELERKKRQTRTGPRKKLEGQRIREIWAQDGKHFLKLPEIPPKDELFPRPERREYRICAVTGNSARYIDPLTKLPYSNSAAFKIIRQKYAEFMAKSVKRGDDGNGAGAEVDRIAQTPAKQRKLAADISAQQLKHSYSLRQ